jgi:2,3-dihydroxyphenylpropionate 1,2-dioxygenase
MGFTRATPMTAIFLNAYVPPQPSPLRCYAFGKALDRAMARMGKRALLIASGGLSHYPGTVHYPHPDVEADKLLFKEMSAGNLAHLLGYDAVALDRIGNLELRMTLTAASLVGRRKPFIALFEPSWHHVYSVHGWDLTQPDEAYQPIYPALPQARVGLVEAVFKLRTEAASARAFLADAPTYCDSFKLAPDERAALIDMRNTLNTDRIRDEFALHALLTAGAATQLNLQKDKA